MPSIELKNISKRYAKTLVLDDVNLVLADNSFNVILGPPASGKSVLLRLLTGLEAPDSGVILMDGQVINDVPPGERNFGYVPQSFALYPHYRVFDNIAYPLRLMGVNESNVGEAVRRVAKMLNIEPLLSKMPYQLSGGEKQRVAIARGIIKDTKIFVLDDPLTGLDFKLRERLFDDLRIMREELGATFVYTTSDPLESLALADSIHLLHIGGIIESGPVERVYHFPSHLYSIELLGFPATNVLDGVLLKQNGEVLCQTRLFSLPIKLNRSDYMNSGTRPVKVAIRPQHLEFKPSCSINEISITAKAILAEDLGGELVVHLESGDSRLTAILRHDQFVSLSESTLQLSIRRRNILVFDADDFAIVARGNE